MELKEAILQTLAEIDEDQFSDPAEMQGQFLGQDLGRYLEPFPPQSAPVASSANAANTASSAPKRERDELLSVLPSDEMQNAPQTAMGAGLERRLEKLEFKSGDELRELLARQYKAEARFLDALQERILVLFQGLQSPDNREIATKVDMILNFLEFVLAIIDEKKGQL